MSENFPGSPTALLPEANRDPRLERLFTPVPTLDEYTKSLPQVSYDFLLGSDDQYQAGLGAAVQRQKEQVLEEKKYTVVTEQSRAQAAEKLKQAAANDSILRDILARYQEKSANLLIETDFVDAIRGDADLRYELGSYLYNEKLPRRLHTMPARISGNTEKSPKHRGYDSFGKLTSQEYAVLLSLAMLDGTFQDPGADRIHRNARGEVELGQHRAAAEELLS